MLNLFCLNPVLAPCNFALITQLHVLNDLVLIPRSICKPHGSLIMTAAMYCLGTNAAVLLCLTNANYLHALGIIQDDN